MKKYESIEIEILLFRNEDIITTSGEADGDETKYPSPGGWGV